MSSYISSPRVVYCCGRLHFNTRGAYFYTHYLLFLLKLYASFKLGKKLHHTFEFFELLRFFSRTQFAMPTGSQTLRFLLAVAAFAVYVQPVKCSFVSKLPTSIRRPVRAWLIANAQIRVCRALRNGLRVILPVSVSFFRRVVLRLAYAQGRPGQTRIPC